jgi:acetylornithine deacetylase/succinyl-diaminopimelate desuccinylase-like protein
MGADGGSGEQPRYDATTGRIHGAGSVSGRADLALKILAASRVPIDALKRPVCIAALQGHDGQGDAALDLVETPDTAAGVALVGGPTGLRLWSDHPGALTLRFSVLRHPRHRRMPPMRAFYGLRIPGRPGPHHYGDPASDPIARAADLLGTLGKRGSVHLLSIQADGSADQVPAEARLLVATNFELGNLDDDVAVEALADGASVPFPVDDLYAAWRRGTDAGVEAIAADLGVGRNLEAARPTQSSHVGRLTTGVDRIDGTLTLPMGPGVDSGALVEAFGEAAAGSLAGSDDLELELRVLDARPALACRDSGAEWIALASEILDAQGLDSELGAGVLSSDAGRLTLHGVPALLFGPGNGADLYGEEESVDVEELERALAFYEAMIRAWCT